MNEIFFELSIILIVATVVSFVMRLIKQPLVIGYIITGLLVGPYFLNAIDHKDTLGVFSEIGIALLLFIIGLNLSPKVIKEFGKVVVIAGFFQILITLILGFLITNLLGFNYIESFFISVALTFSSTIIVLKLLADKREIDTLYGKIASGILIVQDLSAMFVLLLVSGLTKEGTINNILIQTISLGVFLASLLVIISMWVLPKLTKLFAKSQEFLFLFSISYGIGLASIFSYLGFSIEIGALLAGVTLTFFPYHLEIAAKMRPLRDFFLILFFISLGSAIKFQEVSGLFLSACILSAFVIIIKPLVVTYIMNFLGYRQKVSFITGITLSQISEFSLILISLLIPLGIVSSRAASLITIVGIITITISSLMIVNASKIYDIFNKYLFDFSKLRKVKANTKEKTYEAILFGYNRMGFDIYKAFTKLKLDSLVIDYNPDVITLLKSKKIDCRYGDGSDIEFLNELNIKNIKIVVSTIPDFDSTVVLINFIKKYTKKTTIMVTAQSIDEAKKLYKTGASYVILPHFLSGEYTSMLIQKHNVKWLNYNKEKEKHIKYLNNRLAIKR